MTVRKDHQGTSPTNLAVRRRTPEETSGPPRVPGSRARCLVAWSSNLASGSGSPIGVTYRPGTVIVDRAWLETDFGYQARKSPPPHWGRVADLNRPLTRQTNRAKMLGAVATPQGKLRRFFFETPLAIGKKGATR